jgi:ABC-2 type transport system permease protein
MVGALRGGRVARTVIGLAALVAAATAICVALLSLADAPLPAAGTVIVLGGAAAVLGFLVGPILTGTADQLDPRRFRVFGVDVRSMPWILGLASLVSLPSLAIIAVAVCFVITLASLGAPIGLAVLTAVLGVVSLALTARIGMAISALLLPERRSRELTALFVLAVIVVAFPAAVFFGSLEWDGRVPDVVAAATSVIASTPLAAIPGFALAVAAGDESAAWLSGLVALVTVVALWACWIWLVRRLLTSTDRLAETRERSGLGWFGLLPANAFGAIAARSLVYWFRDRRYIVNFVIVPIAGVLTVFPLLVAGVPLYIAALVPVPVMALFFGWLPHNDAAYDSTALWIHVASGVRGAADRFGRLVPIALVAIPVLAVAIPLSLAIVDSWYLLMPMIGLGASLFLGGLGVSSILSVTSPYAVSRPGDSPFQQPQRSESRAGYAPAIGFVGTLVLSAPTIWLFVMTVIEDGTYNPATFWVGAASGVVVLATGAAIGGLVWDRGGARLMEFVETA